MADERRSCAVPKNRTPHIVAVGPARKGPRLHPLRHTTPRLEIQNLRLGCYADGRQLEVPSVLPHSAMLPNKVCCDLSLFHSTSGDEVWRRGRHLSPLLQQLCRSCETVLASPRCFVRPLARETEAGSADTRPGKE